VVFFVVYMANNQKIKDKGEGTTSQNLLNRVFERVANSLNALMRGYDGTDYVAIRVNSLGELSIAGMGATGQTVYNVNVVSADTEYVQAFPDNSKQYFIKARNRAKKLRLSFVKGSAGASAIHMSIPANGYISPAGLDLTGASAFIESNTAAGKTEIIVWS